MHLPHSPCPSLPPWQTTQMHIALFLTHIPPLTTVPVLTFCYSSPPFPIHYMHPSTPVFHSLYSNILLTNYPFLALYILSASSSAIHPTSTHFITWGSTLILHNSYFYLFPIHPNHSLPSSLHVASSPYSNKPVLFWALLSYINPLECAPPRAALPFASPHPWSPQKNHIQ